MRIRGTPCGRSCHARRGPRVGNPLGRGRRLLRRVQRRDDLLHAGTPNGMHPLATAGPPGRGTVRGSLPRRLGGGRLRSAAGPRARRTALSIRPSAGPRVGGSPPQESAGRIPRSASRKRSPSPERSVVAPPSSSIGGVASAWSADPTSERRLRISRGRPASCSRGRHGHGRTAKCSRTRGVWKLGSPANSHCHCWH